MRRKRTVSPGPRMTIESARVNRNFWFCLVKPESVTLEEPGGFAGCCAARVVGVAMDREAIVVPTTVETIARSLCVIREAMDFIH